MAWLGLDKLFLGVDLDAEQKKSDALDHEITTQNQFLVERGVWTPDQYAQFEADEARPTSAYHQDVVGQVNTAFGEGLQEGITKERGFLGGAIDSTVGNFFKLIPWQLWAIGAAALLIYFLAITGAHKKLLGKLA